MSDQKPAYEVGNALAESAIARRERAAAGPEAAAKKAVLLAEGDSWFDYPFQDVLESLEDHQGYEIESVAHKGDNLEDMAFEELQIDRLTKAFEKLAKRLGAGKAPKAVLLSGGGNDIAGDEFAMLLNHKNSRLGTINQAVVDGVIQGRLQDALESLIGIVRKLSAHYFGVQNMRIVVHGYGYPVPDGRGYLGGAWILPGPWLEPGFRRKGHADLSINTEVMKSLIDQFNSMVSALATRLAGQGMDVRYVDVRGLLSNETVDERYQQDWANELHPTRRGYDAVATAFDTAIWP
jgi:lysophospholipase L1-like esterase